MKPVVVWTRLTIVTVVVVLGFLSAVPHAEGISYVVNVDTDHPPGGCDDLSSGDCTLREAINAANAPGADTIRIANFISAISPTSPLPFIDAADGITVNGGDGIQIDCGAPCLGGNFGLAFVTDPGTIAKNISITNVSVTRFNFNGIQVCGGADIGAGACISGVSGVALHNVDAGSNTAEGLAILGSTISGVTVDNGSTYVNNGSPGLLIQAGGTFVTDVTLDGAEATGNGGDGGVVITSGNLVQEVDITGGDMSENDADGLHIRGQTVSQTSISGLVAHTNGGTGIDLHTTGLGGIFNPSLEGNTVYSNQNFGINLDSDAALEGANVIGNGLTGNVAIGIFARGDGGVALLRVADNTMNLNGSGILVQSDGIIDVATVEGNTVTNSTEWGIRMTGLSAGGSVNRIRNNTLTGNAEGIFIDGSTGVAISRNTMGNNQRLGIDIWTNADPPDGVTLNDVDDFDTGPNTLLNYPVITSVTPTTVSGTACANCLVELFISDEDPSGYGEGMTFLKDAVADVNGAFSISLCGLTIGADVKVTATATDSASAPTYTSEFSLNYALSGTPAQCTTITPITTPTVTPTSAVPTPTASATPPPPSETPGIVPGNTDCDGDADEVDALNILAYLGGVGPETDCWDRADANGDTVVDVFDALAILQSRAGIT